MDTIERGRTAGAPPKRMVSAIRRRENILSLLLSGERGGVKCQGREEEARSGSSSTMMRLLVVRGKEGPSWCRILALFKWQPQCQDISKTGKLAYIHPTLEFLKMKS